MDIYVVIFVLLLGSGIAVQYWSEEHKGLMKLYCIATWFVLTMTAALRWGVGLDYNQYHNIFYDIYNAADWEEVFQFRFEPGYLIMTRIFSFYSRNMIVYMFLMYGLMYGILMRYTYKYSEIKWGTIMVYFAFDYFAMSFCFMRQGIAMVIGLFALEMIREKKIYKALIYIVAATMFHFSAWILLLGVFVSYIDIDKKKLFWFYVSFSILLCIECDNILESILIGPLARYAVYLKSSFMGGNSILIMYYPIAAFVLVVCFYKFLYEKDESIKRMIPVMFLGTLLCAMTAKHYVIERVGLYIAFYNIRIIPQIISIIRDRLEKEIFQMALYGILLGCITSFGFNLKLDRYGIIPYCLNEIHLYEVPFFEMKE